MYKPIQLVGEDFKFVKRDSLLFCTCAGCDKFITWVHDGGGSFHGQHCDWVYSAQPTDIHMHHYVIRSQKYDATNVKPFKRPEKEKMVFA